MPIRKEDAGPADRPDGTLDTMDNKNGTAQCRQAMQEFVRGAGSDSSQPQLDVVCGYALELDDDVYAMSAVQGQEMDLDNMAGMLGDFLRMFAEAHNMNVEEVKGVLLRVIAERDNVLPRPAQGNGDEQ